LPKPATAATASPFFPFTPKERLATGPLSLKRGGTAPVRKLALGTVSHSATAGTAIAAQSRSNASKAAGSPLVPSTPPDDLTGFAGNGQGNAIVNFGGDQEVTPPNEDVAAGPTDLVEVVNSTVYVYARTGGVLAANDLNTFMSVTPEYHSSDPRVIYDASAGRFWLTITEVPDSYSSPGNCPEAQPVLIAVSGSSNPLPLSSWTVYALPMETFGGSTGQPLTEFGDQPGLGIATNTVTVTFDDFDCANVSYGSEIDILQKIDFESDSGTNSDDFFYDGPFAPQPVQAIGTMGTSYVLSNQSDCAGNGCDNGAPAVEVDPFIGTPEAGTIPVPHPVWLSMSPTAVDDTTFFLPPADQPSPGPQLQTNDDRFLNAVYENGHIWTADGTSCQPSGDTVQRDCLNYLEIAANSANSPAPTLLNQVNNVGINGSDLFYPAVTVDGAGDMITVFDESSTSMLPSIEDASIPSGGSALSSFQLLHTSATYYNGADLFPEACDSEGCRWGDYSGAAQDPVSTNHVWVVSGSEDSTADTACPTTHACWNTRINEVTLSGPTITALNPSLGPLTGGQTVTVSGTNLGTDTTATFGGSPIAISNLTPTSFTFVTPAGTGTDPVVATDSLGPTAALTYTYIGLANYTAVSPYRILDTRTVNAGKPLPLGPGAIRNLQVTDVGSGTQIPPTATAAVLNVTEVSGSASSLLTVYPYGTTTPHASNLNFAAHTVIANLVTVTLGTHSGQGWIDIFNSLGSVNVLVDVEGYFAAPSPPSSPVGLFHPIAPVRACDTRTPSPTPNCSAHGALGQGQSMMINFATTGGGMVPSGGTADAVVVNLTGVAGSSFTYLTLFPAVNGLCPYGPGHSPPSSTINLNAGAVQANRVMVALGPATSGGFDDAICVYNALGSINVVIDANGWYGSATAIAAGYQFQAIPPTRICDTRISTTSCPEGAIGTAVSRLIPVAGDLDIPAFGSSTTVVAVVANLTAIAPTATTVEIIYPGNLAHRPTVSDLNVNAGEVLPNLAVVELDTVPADPNDGKVYLYNSAGSVNAVIDIEGWFQ
jgi:hypothetical protein